MRLIRMSMIQRISFPKVAVSLILLVLLCILAYFASRYYRDEFERVRKEKISELVTVSELKTAQITEWYTDEFDDGLSISQSSFIVPAIRRILFSSGGEDKHELLFYLNDLKSEHGYEDVMICDAEGNLLISTRESAVVPNYFADVLSQSFNKNEVVSTGLFLCSNCNKAHIDFIAPVTIDSNLTLFLVLRIDPSGFLYPLLSFDPTSSPGAESILLMPDSTGLLIVSPSRFHENMALKAYFSIGDHTWDSAVCTPGYSAVFEGADYRGADVIAYLNSVDETPWLLVTKIDREGAYYTLKQKLGLLLVVFILLGLFLISFFSLIYTNHRRVALKTLLRAREEFRTTIYSIGDAVIVTDNRGLVRNLNPVAENLTGWKENDASGLNVEKIFNIIDEESGMVIESPVAKVLAHGSVAGISSHTMLVKKDGSVIPVADSASPIRDRDGMITGVVLVFRDQTRDRERQAALLDSERKYRRMFSDNPQPMWIYDLETLAFLEVNDAAVNHYGYSREEFLAMTIKSIRPPEDLPALVDDLSNTKLNHNFAGIWRHVRKNGELIYVEVISHLVYFQGRKARHVLVNDVSKHILSEIRIRQQEEYFRAIIEKAPDGIVLLNPSNRITYSSPSALRLMKYDSVEEMPVALDIVFAEDRLYVEKAINELVKNSESITTLEYRYLQKDGSVRWARSTISNLLKEPAVNGLVINFIDITERKKAEAELSKLIRLVDSSLNEIYILNADTFTFEYVNHGAISTLGYSASELTGMHPSVISDYYTPLKIKEIRQTLVSGEKDILVFETSHSCKNGAKYPVEVHMQYHRLDEQHFFFGVVLDITDRKQAAESLVSSESKFRHLFEHHAAVKLLINPETGDIVDANNAACNFYGYSRDELTGLNISRISLNPIDELLYEMDRVKQKQRIHFEFKHRLKDNSIRDVEVFSSAISMSGRILLHSIVHDVTSKKRAESQVRVLIRSIEQSPVGMALTNAQGIVEFVNPRFLQITGYDSAELIGIVPSFLDSGKSSRNFATEIWDVIHNGSEWSGEFLEKRKNGEPYWQNIVISPVLDSDGNISHYILILEDVTEKRRLFFELKEAKEKAEESDRLKTAFLANMSHEIRTPMNGILGFMDLLQQEDLSGDLRDEYISIVKASGNRLLSTINDIIDISKIESGQAVLNYSHLSINQLMVRLHKFFKFDAELNGIELREPVLLSGQPDVIQTDPVKIESILTNLIKNALKFTRKGYVEFGCLLQDQMLEFYVRDTGKGIPAERQSSVFERFVQADVTFSREYEGSGLGLAICKAYVEMMGGEITLESEAGKGSVFFFSLPYAPAHEDMDTSLSRSGYRSDFEVNGAILVAEDDDISYYYISRILAGKPYRLIRALNGQEAVIQCRDNDEIALVLMDIKMPVMDGYEATRQIRSFRKDLPVIALTAYAFEEDRQKSIRAGCNDYVSKPIRKEILFDFINKYASSN